ncbi:MAG TPA: hypothetical protein VFY87_02385 [Geminicoccaceae bacterium]|nr:hypothetical protein [Geminicoccaceae bacterium]
MAAGTPPRVGRLHSVGHVRAELARLYSDGRQGRLPAAECARLASVLSLVRRALEWRSSASSTAWRGWSAP